MEYWPRRFCTFMASVWRQADLSKSVWQDVCLDVVSVVLHPVYKFCVKHFSGVYLSVHVVLILLAITTK